MSVSKKQRCVSVKSPEDVIKFKRLANKKYILARFVMNGCPWCESTQPEWDNMTKKVKLSPDDAIAEIESSFINDFKYMIEPKRKITLPISGFPTVLMIKPTSVVKHEGDRTEKSYLQLLKSKRKTLKMRKIKL